MSASLAGARILQAVAYLLFIRATDLWKKKLEQVISFVWRFKVAVVISLFFNTLFAVTLSSIVRVQTTQILRRRIGELRSGQALEFGS